LSTDSPTILTGPAGSSARRGPVVSNNVRALPLPQSGDRIDSFELEEAIGVGGMGAVFRALDSRLDRHVALKILPPEQVRDPEVVQRFYQEGRAAARLDHENIARVYTIGHDAGHHFIAFEFIEGITVRHRVERDGPLPVAEAVNYTLQIATALVHAAERGVVHRDIKPSNIIITPQGRAKLVDMGLARRFERGGDDGLTQSGMTLGTFDYISPEQARDPRDVDVRSDLYSLGCTLFHMLAGRPPFPEGTVLQKLIQHQEDAPPNVRSINPEVPPDLAAILMKLMAKERDRRYQTPEQLVRDLLIMAGALGLRSVSPEGLLWLSAAPAPTWERHLVWGIPVLGFLLVLAVLAWWGQDVPGTPLPALPSTPTNPTAPTVASKPNERREPADPPAADPDPSDEADDESDVAAPRELSVDSRSGKDLLEILASARPRSTIVLTDDGPYFLGERRTPARLARRDLTIKAASGIRPVLRFAREAVSGGKTPAALLDFLDGHITLEGLEFHLETGDRDDAASIRAENTELVVRRCVFRRQGGGRTKRGHTAAIRLRAAAGSLELEGERPRAVVADSCHFDPGQVGVLAFGPVDLIVRDCTLAATEPALWFENPKADRAVSVDLRLFHDSIVAGEGPVFRFEGTEARVWADDNVIAPARDARATLVVIDDPTHLDWRGRANLYGRVGTFLQATDARSARSTIREASQWSEAREVGSNASDERVWSESDPVGTLAQNQTNPGRAFRLSSAGARHPEVGARKGPSGTLTNNTLALASATPNSARKPPTAKESTTIQPTSPSVSAAGNQADNENESGDGNESGSDTSPMAPMPMTVPPPMPPGAPPMARAPGDMVDMPAMPPMRTPEPDAKEKENGDGGDQARTTKPAATEPTPPRPPAPAEADPVILQTAEQFLNEIARLENRGGGLLRVAANADWELPGTELLGPGRWTIRAELGPTRPRIRFQPAPGEPRAPGAWTSWIDLRSGSLQLEGIDIVLPRSEAPRQGRWAAIAVAAGADLSLTGCTVTIEGDRISSAAVVVPMGEPDEDQARGAAAAVAATVRLHDSLIRTGGDFVEIASGRRIDLDLNDAVVSVKGSLIHGHGIRRGLSPEPIRLKLVLRRVTARAAGGLVQLESTADEPELPIADVNARDSIVATTPQGDPLFRVDGQDALSSLADRIVWEGNGVAYHQVNTYRRDQSAQVGTFPNIYDRPSWTVAVGSKEAAPYHGDVKFLHEWDPGRAPWTLRVDDIRLAAGSPAVAAGADPESIPDPPADSR
jgi:serine/threonine-protein kinase